MIPFVLAIVAPCYMVDPMTNYCITGESEHIIVLPSPGDDPKEHKHASNDDLNLPHYEPKPTDPVCRSPFPVPCP